MEAHVERSPCTGYPKGREHGEHGSDEDDAASVAMAAAVPHARRHDRHHRLRRERRLRGALVERERGARFFERKQSQARINVVDESDSWNPPEHMRECDRIDVDQRD